MTAVDAAARLGSGRDPAQAGNRFGAQASRYTATDRPTG